MIVLTRNRICTNPAEFLDARVVTFLNPFSYMKIMESEVDLEAFDKICIDGITLTIFLQRVFKDPSIERMSFDFTSVARHIFERSVSQEQTGFVLGSDQNSNDEFLKKIRAMYPGINIEGRCGYFEDDEEKSRFIESLKESHYDYIIIGMGAVNQEAVAIALANQGFKGRIYTCGGFIHQTALSGGEYYPAWVDKCNLRFAYRMFKEPSTVRRYLIDYPKAFVLLMRNIRSFKH